MSKNIIFVSGLFIFCLVTTNATAAKKITSLNKRTVSPQGTSSAIRISPSPIDALAGDEITASIHFQGDGSIVEFSVDVTVQAPLQIIGNPIAVGGGTCTKTSPTTVRVSRSTNLPLPSNIRFCDINIKIPTTVSGGEFPIALSNAQCMDDISNTFTCMTLPGLVRISSLQTSQSLNNGIHLDGFTGTTTQTRLVSFTNVGLTNISLSCTMVPAEGLTFTPPATSIAPGDTTVAVVSCAVPLATAPQVFSGINCTSSDSVLAQFNYQVSCQTIEAGVPLLGLSLAPL